MKKISLAIAGTFVLMNSAFASDYDLNDKRAWQSISSPSRMSSTFNRSFSALPLSGSVGDAMKTWSSDYWARNKGGINYRWNAPHPTGFNLKSPTKEEAMAMTQDQLAQLAPSEKWDLVNGRYDYPLKKEIAAYASPSRPSWEGICDGWSAAALNQDEPKPVVVTNPDGIQIPMGSSDLKGILSWYYARKWSGGYGMMGYRCRGSVIGTDKCVNDMNAGAFHIVLTNRVGIAGVSYIADIDKGSQVWNHLAYSYTSSQVGSDLSPRSTSAPGTVKVKRIKTSVRYVYIVSKNSWDPVLGTSGQKFITRNYEYYLDLNSSGTVIGGDWISSQRPDFLWLETHAKFTGYYAKLTDILPDGLVEGEAQTDGSVDHQTSSELIEAN
ncbi:MAG: hypothetical protein ACJ76H_08860 [Bacteriovoracaceae bacterium]